MKKLGVLTKFTHLFDDKEKILASVGASFLLSLTLLFFGPSYIYFTNLLEIPYYYSDIVWFFIAYSLAAGAIISIILILVKGSIHQRFVAIIFALGLLLWIQGQILVWNYGVLDGRAIVWENYLINGLIDSAIWIAILGFAFFKGGSLYRHIAFASLVLLFLQCGGLMVEVYQAPVEPEWKSNALGCDDETKFEFSSEQNVIILVLDTFQSDLFQEIINEDPEYQDIFDGFTYYRNTVGGHPTTYPSVTFILTGKQYNNSIPIQQHIKNEFLQNSVPLLLKENGYRVDLYPLERDQILINEKTASNAGTQNCGDDNKVNNNLKGVADLQQLTLFRFVPHFFKVYFHVLPFVENAHKDLDFYNDLSSKTTVSNKDRIFKFFHLFGVHSPYTLNSQLQKEYLPNDRSGCKEQAKGALKICSELINQLKNNGIYDKSLIFIIGDHGNPWGKIDLNNDLLNRNDNVDINIVEKRVVTSGIPLMLVKKFDSNGDLLFSDSPVTLGDIPYTITSELHIKNNSSGQSIFSVNESDERERKFIFYHWEQGGWDKEYLPPMSEYVVNGHSWLLSSWKPTYRIFNHGEIITSMPKYEWGTPIIFNNNGTAQQYQKYGWSIPEEGFTWTNDYKAVLGLQFEKTESNLTMIIEASPFLGGNVEKQPVKIFINKKEIGDWVLDKPGVQKKSIIIPHEVLSDEMIQYIILELPGAISPNELGQSDDTRNLALAVRSIIIESDSD